MRRSEARHFGIKSNKLLEEQFNTSHSKEYQPKHSMITTLRCPLIHTMSDHSTRSLLHQKTLMWSLRVQSFIYSTIWKWQPQALTTYHRGFWESEPPSLPSQYQISTIYPSQPPQYRHNGNNLISYPSPSNLILKSRLITDQYPSHPSSHVP